MMFNTPSLFNDVRRLGEITAVFLLFVFLVFGVLSLSGNLTAGPRVIDDNQIYLLTPQLEQSSFSKVLYNDLRIRLLAYRRLLPVYSTHKIAAVALYQTNLACWSIHTGLIVVLTAVFLYLFLRKVGFSVAEGLLFALLTLLGEQSIIWWKLLHGEGLGMLFFSLSLVCIAYSIQDVNRSRKWTCCFVVFACLASLSKESFILILPALACWYVWLRKQSKNIAWSAAVTESKYIVFTLLGLTLALLSVIKIYIGRTYFSYTGWKGFDLDNLLTASGQFLSIANLWLGIIPIVLGIVVLGIIVKSNPHTAHRYWAGLHDMATPTVVLAGLIILPQILLYMSSGFIREDDTLVYPGRYLLPAMTGYAILVVSLLRYLRVGCLAPKTDGAIPSSDEHAVRTHHPLTKVPYVLCLVVITLGLVMKLQTSYTKAKMYAAYSGEITDWFETMKSRTAPSDKIVLAFASEAGPQAATRIKIMWDELVGPRDIYLYPFPLDQKMNVRRAPPEMWQIVSKTKKFPALDDLSDVSAVVVMKIRLNLSDFLENEKHWLNPTTFEKNSNDVVGMTFYQKK